MVDPTLVEAATVAGLLTLGGVVLVPRAVVCVGAGAALGWAALGPVMLGSVLGATLGFGLARVLLAGPIRRFLARRPRAEAVVRAIEAEGWRVLGLLRLASPIPGPAINFACGVSRMGFGIYLAATLLGVLPQSALFIYIGLAGREAITSGAPLGVHTLVGALGVALTILALWRVKVAAKTARRDLYAADA